MKRLRFDPTSFTLALCFGVLFAKKKTISLFLYIKWHIFIAVPNYDMSKNVDRKIKTKNINTKHPKILRKSLTKIRFQMNAKKEKKFWNGSNSNTVAN